MKGFFSVQTGNFSELDEGMVKGQDVEAIRRDIEYQLLKFDAEIEFAYSIYPSEFEPPAFSRRGLISDIIADMVGAF